MKIISSLLAFILVSVLLFSQNKGLNSYNLNQGESLKLDKRLVEISGLTFAWDKLFAHDDEQAVIYQLDVKSGKIIKKFYVGNPVLRADFEGISFAEGKFYLITSDGDIYSFSEGRGGTTLPYKKYSTGIRSNIEGLCYDESTNSLLIACKGNVKDYKGKKVVYSFDLKSKKAGSKPKFTISLKELKDKYGIDNFGPSGIEKNSESGNYFLTSASDRAIAEISPDGRILSAVKLNKDKHLQPEGISFSPDGLLFISDEGGRGTAALTIYRINK
ncbi:MAG: SdiA-regulated domain-containing protein [Ignavibacteriaceae bacterium]